jgi:predicted RNA-binding Zn-ribbon protein involved in translation (DUF1610 family)
MAKSIESILKKKGVNSMPTVKVLHSRSKFVCGKCGVLKIHWNFVCQDKGKVFKVYICKSCKAKYDKMRYITIGERSHAKRVP